MTTEQHVYPTRAQLSPLASRLATASVRSGEANLTGVLAGFGGLQGR
ncbi:MAG: hypothetical protein ABSG76_00345 [Xanthobacteraceae bacterium]